MRWSAFSSRKKEEFMGTLRAARRDEMRVAVIDAWHEEKEWLAVERRDWAWLSGRKARRPEERPRVAED